MAESITLKNADTLSLSQQPGLRTQQHQLLTAAAAASGVVQSGSGGQVSNKRGERDTAVDTRPLQPDPSTRWSQSSWRGKKADPAHLYWSLFWGMFLLRVLPARWGL